MPSVVASFSATVEDGKGKRATIGLYSELLDLADFTAGATYESMGDNLLQDLEPITDCEILGGQWTIPVVLDFTPAAADPNSDVEEGATFYFTSDNGFSTHHRVPGFKESLLIPGTDLVDLTQGAVQDWVNTIIDGPDALTGVPEDRFNMTTNRGEDIVSLDSAKEVFRSS